MNTKNALYAVLCGAVVFAGLSWGIPKKAVKAAAVPTPQKGRFVPIQGPAPFNGILDTETGCTWTVHTLPSGSEKATGSTATFFGALGDYSLAPVSFNPSSYVFPKSEDLSPLAGEISRVDSLCDKVRLRALQAAAAR